MLQRGGGRFAGCLRPQEGRAGHHRVRVRQQQHRPDGGGGGAGGRHRADRDPEGQGQCGSPGLRRPRRRHLSTGRRRRHVRGGGRAGDDRRASGGTAGPRARGAASGGGGDRVPAGARGREPVVQPAGRVPVRRAGVGHAERLPGVLPTLREVVPGALPGVRDRDRADRAHDAAAGAADRDPGRVQGPAGGLGEQAADVPRRVPDPPADRTAGPARTPGAVLRPDLGRVRADRADPRPARGVGVLADPSRAAVADRRARVVADPDRHPEFRRRHRVERRPAGPRRGRSAAVSALGRRGRPRALHAPVLDAPVLDARVSIDRVLDTRDSLARART